MNMTGFLFSIDDIPMADEDISQPDYEYHAQALKRVGVSEKSQTYKDVNSFFSRCNEESAFCVLAVWRDHNWAFFYKRNWPRPENGRPFKGQRVKAYLESKNNKHHFFNMDGDYSGNYANH